MKAATAGILSCVAFAAIAAGPSRKIVFGRNGHVLVANIDGAGAKRLITGTSAAFSPDGTQIAFLSHAAYADPADPETHIAVIDIASRKVKIFKAIPSSRCLDPVWSPDGKWIAFQSRRESTEWISDLAVVRPDGTGFNIIKKGEEPPKSAFNSPCWARDGRSIFYHDTINIYRLGLDGVVLGQWKIDKIVPFDYMTGGGRIDVSPDGKRLLLTIDYRKDSDAPPPSLWSFDLTTQAAVRLSTPKELWIEVGCWLDNNNILVVSRSPNDAPGEIYRMSIDGTNVKRLITNARGVSVSAGD